MPSWVKCTTTDGIVVQVNLDQVAMIEPTAVTEASRAAKSSSRPGPRARSS